MARSRGKKALYEVIGKSRMKPSAATEPLHPAPKKQDSKDHAVEVFEDVQEPEEELQPQDQAVEAADLPDEKPETSIRWRKKPRLVQVNSGRVEFSLPLQVTVAVGLALVLAVVGSYRFGQWSISRQGVDSQAAGGGSSTQNAGVGAVVPTGDNVAGDAGVGAAGETAAATIPPQDTVSPPKSTGSNRIVIQTFHKKDDLVPVQQYFAGHGIVTEIRLIRGTYYLVTADKYDNPKSSGTDGHRALSTIVRLGADYKAPEGYESFATHLFNDAFGMKFND